MSYRVHLGYSLDCYSIVAWQLRTTPRTSGEAGLAAGRVRQHGVSYHVKQYQITPYHSLTHQTFFFTNHLVMCFWTMI